MRRFFLVLLVALAGCLTSGQGSSSYYYGTRSSCDRCCRDTLIDRAVGGLVGAVFEELTREPAKPQPMAGLMVRQSHPGRVSTRVLFRGGHLQLIGMPAKSQEEVVLAFRPVAALDEQCDVLVMRDGKTLSVGERVRHTEHELLATLRIDELGASAQLTGLVCGHAFDVDAPGRDAIADFVSRFRARVATGAQSARSNI